MCYRETRKARSGVIESEAVEPDEKEAPLTRIDLLFAQPTITAVGQDGPPFFRNFGDACGHPRQIIPTGVYL
jgi:hypothetical protein